MERFDVLLAIESSADRTLVKDMILAVRAEVAIETVTDEGDLIDRLSKQTFYCAVVSDKFAVAADAIYGNATPLIWIATTELSPELNARLCSMGLVWRKEELTPGLFKHVLPTFVQCHNLRRQIQAIQTPFEKRNLDREIALLMNWYYRTSITAASYGIQSLRESSPEQFHAMVESFCSAIERTLDERVSKSVVATDRTLSDLSNALAERQAGARDIIELYSSALRAKARTTSPNNMKRVADVSRILACELMGHLVSYYREKSKLAIRGVSQSINETPSYEP